MSPTRTFAALALTFTALALPACGDGLDEAAPPPETPAATLPAALFIDAAPADPAHVFDVKQSAKEGDQVTVRGRIGGSLEPFVAGRAVMTIADTQGHINNCSDRPDDLCETPWDYCCDPPEAITANTATVQIVGDDGRALKAELKGTNGLDYSTFVVVTGTVGPRPDANVLVIDATSIHVEK